MRIHKEGFFFLIITAIILIVVNIISFALLSESVKWLALLIFALSIIFFFFILYFFRIPTRELTQGENEVVAPADGKVVVIEEITDDEYFKDRRVQVSIFMSPLNVHVNRNPISGNITYSKYHSGKYLVAWHPKSSTLNERHSVVIENDLGIILVKQIAGALAKRIINYLQSGQTVKQGEELGFIKFGSRVDVLLPPDAKVIVKHGQLVKGGITVIAKFS